MSAKLKKDTPKAAGKPRGRRPNAATIVAYLDDATLRGEVIALMKEKGYYPQVGRPASPAIGTQIVPETHSDGTLKLHSTKRDEYVNFITVSDEGNVGKPVEELHELIRKSPARWAPSTKQNPKIFAGCAHEGKMAFKGFSEGRWYMPFNDFVSLVETWNGDTPQEYIEID